MDFEKLLQEHRKDVERFVWRRFNRDDWASERYGKKWTEILPDNERTTVKFLHICGKIIIYH